jgi:hypothetical protein
VREHENRVAVVRVIRLALKHHGLADIETRAPVPTLRRPHRTHHHEIPAVQGPREFPRLQACGPCLCSPGGTCRGDLVASRRAMLFALQGGGSPHVRRQHALDRQRQAIEFLFGDLTVRRNRVHDFVEEGTRGKVDRPIDF